MKQTVVYMIIVTLIGMLLTLWVVITGQDSTPFIDEKIVAFVQPLNETPLYDIARWLTKLGSKIFLVPFTIVMSGFFLWRFRDWFVPLLFAGGTLIAHILNQFIKHLVVRQRPSIAVELDATGYSFPSGHAMISIVCYGLCLYFLLKLIPISTKALTLKIGIGLLIIAIGLSRVIIHVHYITDVIAGFAFGFLILRCLQYLYESRKRHRMRKTS